MRLIVAITATIAILAPLVWLWQSSLVGSSYSVTDIGTLDYGGGPVGNHDHGSGNGRSITEFVIHDGRKPTFALILSPSSKPQHRRQLGTRLHPQRDFARSNDYGSPESAG